MTRCLPWLLLAVGCGGRVVYVDPRFSDAEQLEILAAADSWNQASGGMARIDIVLRGVGGDGARMVPDRSMRKCGHTDLFHDPLIKQDIVRINPACGEPMADVVAHELGHLMGCDHIIQGAGVMGPHGVEGVVPLGVRCADVIEFCRHNACETERPPACR